MFGYVRPYVKDLSDMDKERYRSVYCGLCRSLANRYGQVSRLTVNYDMTFLALLLSSLYEPEERHAPSRCLPHPVKAHEEVFSEAVDYAADMTIALAYFKCMDDWQDEGSKSRKLMADALERHYGAVRAHWPRQCAAIEKSIEALSKAEKDESAVPEEAIRCAGLLLAELFVWREDFWANQLRWLGDSLGRFVYLMDAAMDYKADIKKGCYNPLVRLDVPPGKARELIKHPLGEASEAFEALPLVQDAGLMRNIIYSGVWQAYNQKMKKMEDGAHGK